MVAEEIMPCRKVKLADFDVSSLAGSFERFHGIVCSIHWQRIITQFSQLGHEPITASNRNFCGWQACRLEHDFSERNLNSAPAFAVEPRGRDPRQSRERHHVAAGRTPAPR